LVKTKVSISLSPEAFLFWDGSGRWLNLSQVAEERIREEMRKRGKG
jgi:hypothetical protein